MKLTVEEIAYPGDSACLFARVRHLHGAIWLDSGKPRALQGRFDIISALPQVEIISKDGRTTVSRDSDSSGIEGDPFSIARQVVEDMGPIDERFAHIPFCGGLMGYWSYNLGKQLHSVPNQGNSVMADMHLGWYGWALIINHQSQQAWRIIHPACDSEILHQVSNCLAKEPAETAAFSLAAPFHCDLDKNGYLEGFQRIQHYIQEGDCYQVNFTVKHHTQYRGDPWYAYLDLRKRSPAPFSAFFQWNSVSVLCCSPERFLKVSMGQVETKPIKGTVARGNSLSEDQENAIRLQNSTKDRAENLMIVDLLRNDISRNCTKGSVRTPKLFALESFANVHHLVSTITGTLAPQTSPLDLLRDSFPGGSITGAPKKRAMEVIDELESHHREIYCGSIGYISASGRMDCNIAIRTLMACEGEITCWGGGGIVADSHAEDEFAEANHKVRNLMSCLEKDSSS